MSDPIVFDGVYRSFGDKAVLRGLDLTVRPGRIHALLGRNGCGKTTALRILLGLMAPQRGASHVLGVDSQRLRPEDRGRIGYVCENHTLYGALTVEATLAFEAGTRPRFDRDGARQSVRRCGLDPRQKVSRLSRGQRAQLALIVAVFSRPEVLVCDDPALGLDAVMRRELLDVMIDLLADRGISVLFSSHFLPDVERIADQVSILNEGRLIVDAPLAALKTRVQKRILETQAQAVARVPGLLRARRRSEGLELLLLDPTPDVERQLRRQGQRLGEALVPNLEELFVDLTAREGEHILPRAEEEAR